MKSKNFYWIAGTIAVVSLSLAGTLFVVQRRRLHDEVEEIIQYIRENRGGARIVDARKGFNPEYYKTTNQLRLAYSTVKSIGDDINDAIAGGILGIGTDENKIYLALNRVANLSQLSQVAEYYFQKTKKYLYSAMEEDLSKEEMNKALGIVFNLK